MCIPTNTKPVLAAIFGLSFFPAIASGQSCPDSGTITTTSYGNLTVREGPAIDPADALNLGADAGVAIDAPLEGSPRFIVTWITNRMADSNGHFHDYILAAGFSAANDSSGGTCIHVPTKVSSEAVSPFHSLHYLPSIAMTATSKVLIGFTGRSAQTGDLENNTEVQAELLVVPDFYFDDSSWPAADPPETGHDYRATVALADREVPVNAIAWARVTGTNSGLSYASPEAGAYTSGVQRRCNATGTGNCNDRRFQFNPSIAMHSPSGYWLMAYAHDENTFPLAPFDICLQLFKPDGSKAHSTPVIVNDRSLDLTDSRQLQPSVDIDINRNIVVTWWGNQPNGCAAQNYDVLYAQRLTWDGTDAAPTKVGSPFIVNSDSSYLLANLSAGVGIPALPPNPCVSLSKSGNGRFLVAWNVYMTSLGPQEIHGQYFDGARPMGGEFRINQENGQPDDPSYRLRRLGNPPQHTVAYGPAMAVCAWSVIQSHDSEVANGNEKVYFTLLPSGFDEYQAELVGCDCPGDMNEDGLRDGRDIQPFITALLSLAPANAPPTCDAVATWYQLFCKLDANLDGALNDADIDAFVGLLLEGAACSAQQQRGLDDCNLNGFADVDDIGKGTSQDCNGNFVPDECDIASETSADVNSNDIPDECEADCNRNGVPDGWDISQSTSNDVNSNGVPDECELDCNANGIPDSWDISQATSADCNQNGEPDECEPDCNENGVPDDCDVDPNDPDGNQQVSLDCNGNGLPDECDLSYGPPFGSLDCNGNGVPDECDIAACENDPACGDCNENGIPDSCDIASEISEDANQNGIPDECEEGGMYGMQQFGGESMSPEAEAAAWEAFYEWCDAHCWGPGCGTSGAEQFEAYVEKLIELGLPVGG